MQSLNLALFDAIAGGFAPDSRVLAIAAFATEAGPWLAAALMLVAGIRKPRRAPYLLIALAVAVATAMLTKDIAAALDSPRPFMTGASPSHIAHGARGGLPSTHAAVMFAVAAMLLLHPALRPTGIGVMVMAAVTAWSRIYLGIHFPLDIVAGAAFGTAIAGAVGLALSTIAGHRSAGEVSVPEATHPVARALLHCNASRYAVLLCFVAAMCIGLLMPGALAADLVREGGPLETVTILLYLMAIVGVLATQRASLGVADKTALGIVLLALAASEADVLDLNTIGTFAVAVLLALSGAWLVLQYGVGRRQADTRPHRRRPVATALMFVAVALFVGFLEHTPVALIELGMHGRLPALLWLAMLSLEETLELLMPMLALLALLQVWLGRRGTSAAAPRTS
ncbi:phosphatase PAP2 family protein [Variovorax sp. RHLX14]|uniref:phosphatase PAP2 family protein n=1 Tax=Variovorax sp. RHLX14 TaxID=1259731 RepID=UPI003F451BF0